MALTYTTTVTRTETEEHELVPYENWSMFTKEGDLRLKEMGQRAVDRLEKVLESDVDSSFRRERDIDEVLITYLVEWYDISAHKSYREASDTAVREVVMSFFTGLCLAAGFNNDDADRKWYKCRDEAHVRVGEST